MTNLWNREPALILGAINALLALGLAFGLNVTPMQIGAIMAAASAIIAVITRQTVTSPASLQNLTPKTLAAAQDAAQPVKDTIRKLPVWLLACALELSACASAPPNLSPAAVSAFNNTRVQKALDLIRDTVDDGSKTVPPLFSGATDVKVATWHESAIKTIHATGNGWQATVKTGLDELVKDLPPAERQIVAPYATLAVTIITEVTK